MMNPIRDLTRMWRNSGPGTQIISVAMILGYGFIGFHAYKVFAYTNPPPTQEQTLDQLDAELSKLSDVHVDAESLTYDDAAFLIITEPTEIITEPTGSRLVHIYEPAVSATPFVVHLDYDGMTTMTILDGDGRNQALEALGVSERVYEALTAENSVAGNVDPLLVKEWRVALDAAWDLF